MHIGGSLTHWEKANTQFANSVAFLTELATPLHPGLPAASRRSPDPTFRRRLISIDGRPGFRPSSPRFRQRQAGKQHGSVHEGPPGGNNGGKESGSRCPHQSFTSSGRELFPGSGLPHPTLQTPDRAPARASQARQGRRLDECRRQLSVLSRRHQLHSCASACGASTGQSATLASAVCTEASLSQVNGLTARAAKARVVAEMTTKRATTCILWTPTCAISTWPR